MKTVRWGAWMAGACLLSSCGGAGDSGSSSSTVSVTPSPAASPSPPSSPTPTPSAFSYRPFDDLTVNRSFQTGSEYYVLDKSSSTSMPKLFAGSFWLNGATVDYTASTGNFGGYMPSDRVESGLPDVLQYKKTVNGTAFDFSIITPRSGGAAFTYGRFGKTIRQTDQETSTTYSVLGVPTQAGDIPVAPYPSYSRSAVIGDAFRLVRGEGSALSH